MGAVRTVTEPGTAQINRLLEKYRDSLHCFSGIDAFPMVYRAFRLACTQGIRPLLYLEPYEWRGWKGFLRRVKYTVHRLRYGKSIRAILTTGSRGKICYERAFFSPGIIFDWGYFTDVPPDDASSGEKRNDEEDGSGLPRLLFVGRLDGNKRILPLLEELMPLRDGFSRLDIIGRGPLETEVKRRASACAQFHFLGVKQTGRFRNGCGPATSSSCPVYMTAGAPS